MFAQSTLEISLTNGQFEHTSFIAVDARNKCGKLQKNAHFTLPRDHFNVSLMTSIWNNYVYTPKLLSTLYFPFGDKQFNFWSADVMRMFGLVVRLAVERVWFQSSKSFIHHKNEI